MERLFSYYESFFEGGLGTIKGVTAHLTTSLLSFTNRDQFLFVFLKKNIAEEIRRLESISVLEKVNFFDWATPIVAVLKTHGIVKICGGYLWPGSLSV